MREEKKCIIGKLVFCVPTIWECSAYATEECYFIGLWRVKTTKSRLQLQENNNKYSKSMVISWMEVINVQCFHINFLYVQWNWMCGIF